MKSQSTPNQSKSPGRSLTEGPVPILLAKLTLPMIFGMMSTIIFNMVDTYFVSKLGTTELAAMTFTFPVVLIVGALAQGIGVATSTLISRAIGKQDQEMVVRYTVDSLILGLLIVLIFAVSGLLTIEPLFKALGATDELLPLIKDYMNIWYVGTIFIVIPMIGNSAIRALGDTKTPSMIMMVSAVANLIMDPLLIFGLGPFPALGIQGAAIATVISRATTLFVSLYVLIYKEKIVHMSQDHFKTLWKTWKQILYIGLPNAFTKLLTPIAAGIITGLIAGYGKEAVAAFGIATKLEMFALLVSGALATVIAPFIGQNLGAGKLDRVRQSLKVGNAFQMAFNLIIALLLMTFGRHLALIFTADQQVITIIHQYLLIVPLSYGMQGVLQVNTTAFNIVHKPITAAMLMIVRMFVVYIPLAMFTSSYYGLQGIWYSILISFAVVTGISHFMLKKEFNESLVEVHLA